MSTFEFRIGQSTSTAAVVGGAGTAVQRSSIVEEYAWEQAYERTWDAVVEDESGLIRVEASAASRRPRLGDEASLANVQRGMLRHTFLVLDHSRAMDINDFKPTRAAAVAQVAKEFVREYFDQNPISTLGVIIVHEGRASKINDLSANSKRHEAAIEAAMGTSSTVRPSGDFTLQAPLEMASRTLALLPTYGTREVVVIHGTHAICDPGDINATITELQKASVRVSVISLPGEVYIASRVASATGGQYAVPEHYDGLRTALLAQCPPPPRRLDEGDQKAAMVPMGFPTLVWEKPAICACHKVLKPKGYVCPRCRSMMCDVPTTCVVCRLQLVSAAALARSYHHLFPVPLFVEVPDATKPALVPAHVLRGGSDDAASAGGGVGASATPVVSAAAVADASSGAFGTSAGTTDSVAAGDAAAAASDVGGSDYVSDASTHCAGCCRPLLKDRPRYVCPACRCAFCDPCDAVIHDTLHNCPGCA